MKQKVLAVLNPMKVSSAGTQAGYQRGKGLAYRAGVAVRPTLLFMVAFALNITPHEAAHAATGYMLGFSSTLY